MSKHKVVFGGSVGVQDANAEGAFGSNNQEQLMEDLRNNLNKSILDGNLQGDHGVVKEYDNEGDASFGAGSIQSETSEKKREFERIAHKSYMDANRHRLKTNKFFRKNTKLAEKVLNEVNSVNHEKSKSPEVLDQEKNHEDKHSLKNRSKTQVTTERIKYKNYKPSAII